MAVYVTPLLSGDWMYDSAYTRVRCAHMFADSPEELEEFAKRVYWRPRGYHISRTVRIPNYTVEEWRRDHAITLGAIPLFWPEVRAKLREWLSRNPIMDIVPTDRGTIPDVSKHLLST